MKRPKYLENSDCTTQTIKYRYWEIDYLWAEIPCLVGLNKWMDKEGMEFPWQGKLEEQIMVKIFGGSRMSENKGADFTCEDGKAWEVRSRDFSKINVLNFCSSSKKLYGQIRGEDNTVDAFCDKLEKVDGFIVIDTQNGRSHSELHIWRIPARVISELYLRDEWKACNKRGRGRSKEIYDISAKTFLNTMENIGLNTTVCV